MLAFEGVGLTRCNADGDVPVLRDVDFEVPRGKVFTILGPSGSGKSTLLRLACRLEDPDRGRILLDGRDVRETDVLALRRRVGFLAQEPTLFGASVEENLRFAADPSGRAGRDRDWGASLRQVGLPEAFLSRAPDALSLGQRQRVALARALLAGPEVLLLDEPTSALDPQATSGILGLVRELRDRLDLTIVFVTHIVEHARAVADRALFLKDGAVLEQGGPEVLVTPQREETRAFLAGEEES
jgi:putative ABC transport system ATP-binding protein